MKKDEVKISDNIRVVFQAFNDDNFSVLFKYSCDCLLLENEKRVFILEIDYFGLFKKNNISNFEVIIIDDFSNDGSRDLLNNLNQDIYKVLLNEKNFGKGYSLRKGFEIASGDIIIIQDSDLEYDPSDYKTLLNEQMPTTTMVHYGYTVSAHGFMQLLLTVLLLSSSLLEFDPSLIMTVPSFISSHL